MEILTTATGREINCDYFNYFQPQKRISLRVIGISESEARLIFENPAETAQLWCAGQYIANHTNLKAIIPEGNAIRIVLEQA